MAVFYVFQGETYKRERAGGYVWAPQRNRSGGKNSGYTMMTKIRKGDFILHNANSKIVAVSIAKSDCYEAEQPSALEAAKTTIDWMKEGYRVDCKYFEFDVPIKTSPMTTWLAEHYVKGSAFTSAGRGKQQYMCRLADEHAIYILQQAIRQQTHSDTLKAALSDIVDDRTSEYTPLEMEYIRDLVEHPVSADNPEWPGVKEAQAMTISSATGRPTPKRNPQRAADALRHAEYKCEYNSDDRTFLRKSGTAYTEPHHLIPISEYRDFNYSVDVMENIISLCSHCHNLLHYGRFEDKVPILTKLYNNRKDALHNAGLDLALEQLLSYYK